MIPSGFEATACSTIRAISAKSPVGGLRYSTFASTASPASLIAFLMVFHQESASSAWLTNTKRSPAACAIVGAIIAPAVTTPANNSELVVFIIFFISYSSVK